MDLKSKKWDQLKQFMYSNNCNNFVKNYTRIATRFYKKSNKSTTSNTLIDVVIHNKNKIRKVMNVNCPFSDRKFIITELKVHSEPKRRITIQCRNLSQKNLDTINDDLKTNNLTYLHTNDILELKWDTLKNNLLSIINKTAKKRTINLSSKIKYPWSDKELSKLQNNINFH